MKQKEDKTDKKQRNGNKMRGNKALDLQLQTQKHFQPGGVSVEECAPCRDFQPSQFREFPPSQQSSAAASEERHQEAPLPVFTGSCVLPGKRIHRFLQKTCQKMKERIDLNISLFSRLSSAHHDGFVILVGILSDLCSRDVSEILHSTVTSGSVWKR